MHGLVRRYGGVVTCPFSQMVGETRVALNSNEDTAGGICAALSNEWLIEHAHGGSLWNKVYKNDKIDVSVVRSLCARFLVDSVSGGKRSGTIQSLKMKSRLLDNGIIPRSRMSSGHAPLVPMRQTNIPYGARRMAADPLLGPKLTDALKAFKSYGRGMGCYVHIGVFDGASAENGGHSMVAYLGGSADVNLGPDMPFSDICLFDPNYGEFWFGTRQQHHKTDRSRVRTLKGDFKSFMQQFLSHAYVDFGGFLMTCYAPRAS
jgi:hypothetical protein